MGKTMPKSTIIYGQQHAIAVSSFSGSHLKSIMDLLEDKVGPEVVGPLAGQIRANINHAVSQAKANKKMKDAYVKIGLIDGDMVLRCKEKKFFGDIEIDATLIKSYKPKASKYAVVKQQKEMEAIEQAAAERRAKEKQAREEQERQARLKKVMNTPDSHGETMRDKLLRAADKGKKLGVGQGTQERHDQRGLTEMDPQYHGEVLDHQKNRYGRYLNPLIEVWKKAQPGMNMSVWLDEVEKANTSVKGVAEARSLTDPEVGNIVQALGTAGGLMVYLDDNTRKPYEARVSKGAIAGTHVKASGVFIFVIGSDNKAYAGPKQRATPGVRGAFNHSSFFSGAPVRSAGTLKVSGGKITEVHNASGHYTPTRAMIATAIRKFGGNGQTWLSEVRVIIGSKTQTGLEFMNEDANVRAQQTWGKYSHGKMDRNAAENLLRAGQDGSWLVRTGSDGSFVVSYRKGTTLDHKLASLIGQFGLDRKLLILPDHKPEPSTLKPESAAQLRQSPAYHGNLDRSKAEALLQGKTDGAWLLREGRNGLVAFSCVSGAKVLHSLANSEEAYRDIQAHMRTYRTLRVTA